MTSRLDRLFLLLETGSSPVTRKAAALQLGEVQKLHPHELHNLLSKVRHYLHSNSWDTRIASGQAVEAIIRNVPQWDPPGKIVSETSPIDEKQTEVFLQGRLNFSKFDIYKVMSQGNDLLGSEGLEYELDDNTSSKCAKVDLAEQRLKLNKRLGLDLAEKMGLDTKEIFSNDDLVIKSEPVNGETKPPLQRNLSEVFESEINIASGSNREATRNRRRSRIYSKQKSKDSSYSTQSPTTSDAPPLKKTKNVLVDQSTTDVAVWDSVLDNEGLWEDTKEWPFEGFCEQLSQDLFHSSWEVRHGSATAIREIVRIHGKGAGRLSQLPSQQMEAGNQAWLEDMSLRLICVLALDKFGDYVSDQVVAPVRETCAQSLGSILNLMQESSVNGVLQVLLQLLRRKEWEARHGGLLGMKYLLVVREDMRSKLIPVIFDPIFQGLQDAVDDVSAAAAAALVPITKSLITTLPDRVPSILMIIWEMLPELDDLTSSTSSILMLLASLLAYPLKNTLSSNHSLAILVPRLWPFLGHNSTVVRKSVLQALEMLATEFKDENCESWLIPILADALRLIFQRCLVEHSSNIHELLYRVWNELVNRSPLIELLNSSCPFVSGWLCLMMHPARVAIDPAVTHSWLTVKKKTKELGKMCKGRKNDAGVMSEQFYIGGSEFLCESITQWEINVMKARIMASKFMGQLSKYVTKPVPGIVYTSEMESPVDCFARLILFHLNSKSALQRLAVGLVVLNWAREEVDNECPLTIKDKCLQCLNENILFDEIAISFTRMQQECRDFMAILKHHKLDLEPVFQTSGVLTLEQSMLLSTTVFEKVIANSKLKPKTLELLEDRRKSLHRTVTETSHNQVSLNVAVQSTLASALVSLNYLPLKLNPLIRPLMESLKKEQNEQLQKTSAQSLVRLMELCISRTPCPNPKIIKNLTNFLLVDTTFAPLISGLPSPATSSQNSEGSGSNESFKPINLGQSSFCNKYDGILTLYNMQKSAEKASLFKRSNSITAKKSGTDLGIVNALRLEEETEKLNKIQRDGATSVFIEAASYFGHSLPEKLPTLWNSFFNPLTNEVDCPTLDISKNKESEDKAQELVNNLLVLKVTGPSVHSDLHGELEKLLPHLVACLDHPYTAVRHMASQCLGMMCRVITEPTMDILLNKILNNLDSNDDYRQKQGAVEAIACIIEQLGLEIVPYIVLLIVPMLGRMSDQNESIRLLATHSFASLIRLMPLEGALKDPPKESEAMSKRKQQERKFLEQLLDPKKLENFQVPVPIKAEIRSYQQAGVNWLAFLNKYKLHGILCDDMGLGKTLQSICILSADHYLAETKFKESPSPDCKPLPSLIVCPPTLTGHWVYEIEKFVSPVYLNPIHYTGVPMERMRLRKRVKKHNIVIASYDIVRNDIEFFGDIHWNYCILDEGHIIKNGKTKLSRAIKQLLANHRLILSGTPIQNNVLELWSLFDFLMPGFLGTEKQFNARYSKPILQSRDAKSSSKEQEAGVLAMESLHRQVLPFLLRRMKEDVLQDLPPKIIQDYYCELSPLQVQLYEDFAKSRARKSLEDDLTVEEEKPVKNTSHIFQALQYLRKVCNHPKLVLNNQHPEFERITAQLKQQNSSLHEPQHAAKLSALKQLLLDCGIGLQAASGLSEPECAVNQHRALVFCQLKSMLDILEKDLLRNQMPSVTYMRLDGSIPPGSRHAVVHRFNNDPSIDLLLLTTQVGGLGLNLTGADTVIFVEHDWNPMKDLQAMDRAHRIGQKKVVNVYRLITRGTLEEKIMGLQKFKINIANTIISQENSSLQSMGTDQLLDLFTLDDINSQKSPKVTASSSSSLGSGSSGLDADKQGNCVKSVLENMPDLWDTDQYETEYDLDNFLKTLSKN